MADPQNSDHRTTPEGEAAVKRWRAHEKAAFALFPIMEREGYDRVSAGELADAAIEAFERAMNEPLPEGWRKYA